MAKDSKYSRSSRLQRFTRKGTTETDEMVIGFLAFEISSLMSRLIQLWNRLEDKEFTRVKKELANSAGIKKLVSEDENFLTTLFLNETVDDLQYIARSITRFGNRCSDPVIHEFELFVKDPTKNDFDWFGLQYRWKKMEKRVKKMQRFVEFTTEFYRELEVLSAVERAGTRSFPVNFDAGGGGGRSIKYKTKLAWHRRQVKNLKEMTPWNRGFDYVLRLFMRSIITIIERIKIVFEVKEMPFLEGFSGSHKHLRLAPSRRRSFPSSPPPATSPAGHLRRLASEPPGRYKWIQPCGKQQPNNKERKNSGQFAQNRAFKNSNAVGSDSPAAHRRRPIRNSSTKLNGVICTEDFDPIGENENRGSSPRRINGCHYSIASFFSKHNSPITSPSTLGDAALAVHYARMIILVEKFACAPNLIGVDERDELFSMLPATIRAALRSRLKSAAKIQHPSFYDPVLATEWKSAMTRILQWLAPLAHNTETWHSEQSFERQYAVARSPALLVQTLHYANKEKTEAALMELLVALNNICSTSEVYRRRLTYPIGVQARRGYFCRKDEFSFEAL